MNNKCSIKRILILHIITTIVISLSACGGCEEGCEEKLPLVFKTKYVPLDYKYSMDFGAFNPEKGTVGNVESLLKQPKMIGNDFPFDIVAVMQYSGEIVRFDKSGKNRLEKKMGMEDL